MTDITVLVDCRNTLGEGPLWDVDEQRLYWIDSHHNQIFRTTADGHEVEQWTVPATIGSMALRREGGAVVSLRTGLHLYDFKTCALELITHPEHGRPNIRLNDGKVDREGRFVVGSYDETMFGPEPSASPRGVLYRLDVDLTLNRLEEGIGVSNGPCWSPDGRTFYFADTWANKVWAYDWDATGTPSRKRVFVAGSGPGMPDGATVDSEGFLWNAWNGASTGHGEIRRYAPDGTLDRRIELPSLKVTSLMFGGPELDVLYVTSMGMSGFPEDRPVDGALFAIKGLSVRGVPERRFVG